MSLSKLSKVKTLGKSSAIFTKTIVQMNDVSASYDSKNYVLKDIKMSIDRGTNYAIVGHSGSGKSTLLRLINGMMNPNRGKILVDYQTPNISDKKFKSFMHKIGYIPQNLGLIKNSTVLENILIGALPRVSGFNSFLKKFQDKTAFQEKVIGELKNISHSFKGLARGMDELELSAVFPFPPQAASDSPAINMNE